MLPLAAGRCEVGMSSRWARGPVGILAIGALGEVIEAKGLVGAEDGRPGEVARPGTFRPKV